MRQVMLNIENRELEKQLMEESKKKGQKLATIILDFLEKNYLRDELPPLQYKKLDPLKHMKKIEYLIDESEDLSDVKLFEKVKDSAEYIKQKRKTFDSFPA